MLYGGRVKLKQRIGVALGEEPADLLLKNAKVVSVLSGQVFKADVAISEKYIVGFGNYKTKKVIDLKGLYVSSGFFDAHMHLESTMLTPSEFAKTVVPMGTTAVIIDPHEIANVMGMDGIHYMLKASRGLPLDIYVMLPSCVPATNMETSGAKLFAEDLELLAKQENVLGLAEMMDFQGVLNRRKDVLDKLQIPGLNRIDGHAPGLSGKELNAYALGNIRSDHECTTIDEAREKLNAGLHIMIREGTVARNLEALLPVITSISSRRCLFCTDDKEPEDLVKNGHINHVVKKAISLGLDPVEALMIASANAADYFRLPVKQGAVAAGYKADLIVFDDLKKLNIRKVIKNGKIVSEDGEMIVPVRPSYEPYLRGSVNVKRLAHDAFRITTNKSRVRVIELVPNQIIAREKIVKPTKLGSEVVSDTRRDIIKLAVVERHRASGNIGLGLVTGFGLRRGAIATSVAHDSHNIIVAGVSDTDMKVAVERIIDNQGGMVIVAGGKVIADLPLKIAGLMSAEPVASVVAEMKGVIKASREIGCALDNPFQALSFLSLPVIPDLKLTDRGLIDVAKQAFVPLSV